LETSSGRRDAQEPPCVVEGFWRPIIIQRTSLSGYGQPDPLWLVMTSWSHPTGRISPGGEAPGLHDSHTHNWHVIQRLYPHRIWINQTSPLEVLEQELDSVPVGHWTRTAAGLGLRPWSRLGGLLAARPAVVTPHTHGGVTPPCSPACLPP
jgi:hypothetical protein